MTRILMMAVFCWGAQAQEMAPRIFFTDLESGPNRGGEEDRGAFVTIYGNGFGSQRGASVVTVGGGEAAVYKIWGEPYLQYQKIVVQLGLEARTGMLAVRTTRGVSNGVPFTVRGGQIYCAAPGGNDSASGGFGNCWRSLPRSVRKLAPGDILYAMDGTEQTTQDTFSAALVLGRPGTAEEPKALLAYPGARVVVGVDSGISRGILLDKGLSESPDGSHWVIGGLRLRGNLALLARNGVTNLRVAGNDFSCPNGDGAAACLETSQSTQVKVLGNHVHDISTQSNPSKMYHAVYFTTDSNQIEAGWNRIVNNNACRAIQFHSSPNGAGTGLNQYDLKVHDNYIESSRCDAINFATVDPSRGPVEAYNNVIINAGRGPHPRDGPANYACVLVAGTTNAGADGSGAVEVYNNTCYYAAASPVSFSAYVRAERSPRLSMNLRNNLTFAAGQRYTAGDNSTITGSNNLWFGSGGGPGFLRNNVDANPLFLSTARVDLRPGDGSAAIDRGVDTRLTTDFTGLPRPQGRAIDIGAFEVPQAGTRARPAITPGGVADVFAGQGPPFAPGQLVSVYGSALGPAAPAVTGFDARGRLPFAAEGVEVLWNGVAAPLYFVSAGQLNVQVPYELAGRDRAAVVVTAEGLSSEPEDVRLAAARPVLFPRIFRQDGVVNTPETPSRAGEFVVMYASGQGVTDPPSRTGAYPDGIYPPPGAPVQLLIGGRNAELIFTGQAPGTAGVMQINARVPDGVPPGDTVPVVLSIGANRSQDGVWLALR